MKKITSILIAAVMLLSLIPCAFAETVADGECGDSATWTLDDAGTLTISGSGIVYYDEWRRRYGEDIKKVVVKEGITELDDLAIRDLANMTEILLPESLTRIGNANFRNCSSLVALHIPAGVTDIESLAISNCAALGSFSVDDGNEYYKAVDSVLYSKDGKGLVAYPPALNNTSYTVPEGTEIIYGSVFTGVDKLKTVSIPSTVTDIYSLFVGCSSLEKIEVSEDNESYMSENGILFSKDKTRLCTYPRVKSGAYTIPDSVVMIEDNAFDGCSELDAVTIPESVKVIREEAFANCTGLGEIYIPSGVTTMQDAAFDGCTSIKKAVVKANITSLYSCVFRGCTHLEEVELPESIIKINSEVFMNCYALESITIPEGVTTIATGAFRNCGGLEEVYLPSTIATIQSEAFSQTIISDVYYNGTQTEWEDVSVNDSVITHRAEIHYIAKPYINDTVTCEADAENGGYTVTVPLRQTELDYKLIAAVYDGTALKQIFSKTAAKNSDTDTLHFEAAAGDNVKVFVWNGFSGIEPSGAAADFTVE